MHVFKFIFLFFLSFNLLGFTLSSANPYRYTIDEVPVHVASDGCATVSLDAEALLDLVIQAMDDYWHKVHTTRITFKKGSVLSNATAQDKNIQAFANAYAQGNAIVVGCTANGFSATGLGVGTLAAVNGVAAGVFMLGDTATVEGLSQRQKLATMAHELGHSIGIGHSNEKIALMYYTVSGKTQEHLHRDDAAAITYLYPHDKKASGLIGSCGTIDLDQNDKGNFLISFLLGLFLIALLKLKKRKFI